MPDGFVQITGMAELDENLSFIADVPAKRIGGRVVMKLATVAARGIRSQIPPSIAPRVPDKGIGARRMKLGANTGVAAKAGIAVGSASKTAGKFRVVNRGRRKGVGVTARNLHWFAAGTKARYTGSKTKGRRAKKRQVPTGNPRKYTGRIDKSKWGGFVQRGVQMTESQGMQAAKLLGERLIAEEMARIDPGKRTPFTV